MLSVTLEKPCKECGLTKPLSGFHKHDTNIDGHRNICRNCANKVRRMRRWSDPKHREKVNRLCRRYYWTIKETEEYQKKLPQKRTKALEKYYENMNDPEYRAHLTVIRKRGRDKRMSEHPFYFWARDTIKRHFKWGYKVEFTVSELEMRRENTSSCGLCGNLLGDGTWNRNSLDRINADKILTSNNTRIVCCRCNTMKSAMSDVEFINHCRKIVERA